VLQILAVEVAEVGPAVVHLDSYNDLQFLRNPYNELSVLKGMNG